MPPVVIAGAVAGAGAIGSAAISSSAAKKAAKGQQQSAAAQIAAQKENRDYQYNLNAPTIAQGSRASELYAGFLGAGGGEPTTDWEAYVRGNPDAMADWQKYHTDMNLSDYGQYHYKADGSKRDLTTFQTSPQSAGQASAEALATFRGSTGYQDLLKQGLGAVNSNAYARGMGDSGATLKALQARGTAIADSSANQWLGGLTNLMNAGGQARGLVAGIGTNAVNANNQALQSAADASGNARMAAAGQTTSAIGSLLNAGAYAYGSSYGGMNSGAGMTGATGGYGGPIVMGGAYNRFMGT